jgi:Ankyrin repeats (many copies)
MLAPTQKGVEAGNSNSLSHISILQQVLAYVGPNHWWYVATVCSLWRDLYQELASVQLVGHRGLYDHNVSITCAPQMTLYSAVFSSASRVRSVQKMLDCTAEECWSAAGRYADADTLRAAHAMGMPYTLATMRGCARCNKHAVMQFLHAEGCPWDEPVCAVAAESGRFEMLRWALEHGCDWQEQTILQSAASSGNIEMTAWVMQQPAVLCSSQAIFAAAARGHTAMCEYLRAEGLKWLPRACAVAAQGGHLDTLRWLNENGCRWSGLVCSDAAAGGSIDVLCYVQQQGIDFNAAKLTEMLLRAGVYKRLAAAQWLRQQGLSGLRGCTLAACTCQAKC